MADANFKMRLELDGRVFHSTSYCREVLLYSTEGQRVRFDKFKGLTGSIEMSSHDFEVRMLEEERIPFIERFYPEFKYEFDSVYRINIPQQGLSAQEAHAILGILRDGINDRTQFLLYLVHRTKDAEVVPYRNSFWHSPYNGPNSWAKMWLSMETLYEVCQEYISEFDFPLEKMKNTYMVRTFYKTFFLQPEFLIKSLEKACLCACCNKDVYTMFFTNAARSGRTRVREPWKCDVYNTHAHFVLKRNVIHRSHRPKDNLESLKFEGIGYPRTPAYVLGKMLSQGGDKK